MTAATEMWAKKCAEQTAENERLRAALAPDRLGKIIGRYWMSSPKENEILDRCIAEIRDPIQQSRSDSK